MTRLDSTDRAFATALAALAGYIDAIGFLATGGFFVSFMSGNTTRLGAGLAAWPGEAGVAARLILMFVGGVTLGSLLARATGAWRRPIMLTLIACLIALCGWCDATGRTGVAIALLAMVMGMQNTILEDGNAGTISITYMTGTLVRVGQRLAEAIADGPRWDWLPPLVLWTGLMTGAWVGAAIYLHVGMVGLRGAAAAALLLAIVSLIAPARRA